MAHASDGFIQCTHNAEHHYSLFHADPHRGNLLRTPQGDLAVIDFGMMADIPESDRYGLIGLVLGLKNKDLSLATENLLKVLHTRITCTVSLT